MCGRFVSASGPDELARYFEADAPEHALEETYEANYNVAPTTTVFAVRASEGHRQLSDFRWGLIPFWAKDRKVGSRMINARSETVLDKPAFRRAVRKRRCLIPADGFYEWAKIPGPDPKKPRKQPYFISHRDGEPLVFAGLWERWSPPEGSDDELGPDEVLESCTILTCAANDTMTPVHDRMPVLLAPADWDRWLAPTDDVEALTGLLVPAPEEILTLQPVTTRVNNVRNRGPELLEIDPDPLVADGE